MLYFGFVNNFVIGIHTIQYCCIAPVILIWYFLVSLEVCFLNKDTSYFIDSDAHTEEKVTFLVGVTI